ncbi:glycosyltransferase family 4 protein [Haloarchaeobius sp. HME9146]|uniref:glycosyltransferase family 4 protein n=1 Tax=Haloarchaeobius sp. HME9146 TaxID=2978732 RepID=UPI0021C0A49B|nr:glycosyltransferase family 4 protein [Haloarchaeobius sp. HME9146]MCT9098187.1 glycosyltransferase family 4 protein [Haloarchaeobius sp. HME9146]
MTDGAAAGSREVLFLSKAGVTDQSTQHRIDPIADELREREYNVSVIHGKQRSIFGRPFRYVAGAGIVELLSNGGSYDAVVMNRDGSPTAYLAALLCNRKEIPLIFDIDDALYHQKRIDETPIPIPGRIFLDKVIQQAAHVTTGNSNIESELSSLNSNITTIPTPVDASVFQKETDPAATYDSTVLGWMGIGPGHEHNLRLLREPLMTLGKKYDITFRMVSSLGNGEIRDTFTEVEQYVDVDYGYNDRIPLKQVRREMATFDIAVLPLNPSDEMMEGKSIIKVLEHLAMGLPVVASDALAYGDLLTHDETGLLADTTEDWVSNIERLINDEGEKNRLAEAGYQMVVKDYTVESYVDQLETVIDTAVTDL